MYKTDAGKAFIAPVIANLMKLTPWTDVGLRKRDNLGALNQTVAVAGLVEVSFHDNPTEAKWMHDNIKQIAAAIVDGLYKGMKLDKPVIFPAPLKNMPVLKIGSMGDAVIFLQSELAKKKLYSGLPDGVFGPRTEAAVKSFQTLHKLKEDGIVGPFTWAKLIR